MSDHSAPAHAPDPAHHDEKKAEKKEDGHHKADKGAVAASVWGPWLAKYGALILAIGIPSCIGGQALERTETGKDLSAWRGRLVGSEAEKTPPTKDAKKTPNGMIIPGAAPVTIVPADFAISANEVRMAPGKARPAGYHLGVMYTLNGKAQAFLDRDADAFPLPAGYTDLHVRFLLPGDPPLVTPYVKIP